MVIIVLKVFEKKENVVLFCNLWVMKLDRYREYVCFVLRLICLIDEGMNSSIVFLCVVLCSVDIDIY